MTQTSDPLQRYRDDIIEAAEAWVDSHPGYPDYVDENETTRRRGYLYDRVRRLRQAREKLEAETVSAIKSVVAEKREAACPS